MMEGCDDGLQRMKRNMKLKPWILHEFEQELSDGHDAQESDQWQNMRQGGNEKEWKIRVQKEENEDKETKRAKIGHGPFFTECIMFCRPWELQFWDDIWGYVSGLVQNYII